MEDRDKALTGDSRANLAVGTWVQCQLRNFRVAVCLIPYLPSRPVRLITLYMLPIHSALIFTTRLSTGTYVARSHLIYLTADLSLQYTRYIVRNSTWAANVY